MGLKDFPDFALATKHGKDEGLAQGQVEGLLIALGWRQRCGRRRRQPKRPQSVVEGISPRRQTGKLDQAGDRFAPIACLQVVMAELIRDLLLITVMKLLDSVADSCVQQSALLWHKLLISDPANPVVAKVDSLAISGQDMAAHQFLDGYCSFHFADLSGPREQCKCEVAADCSSHLYQEHRQAG